MTRLGTSRVSALNRGFDNRFSFGNMLDPTWIAGATGARPATLNPNDFAWFPQAGSEGVAVVRGLDRLPDGPRREVEPGRVRVRR